MPPLVQRAGESAGTSALRARARLGIIALTARSVLQSLLILGANLYLARTLAPADYGLFSILQFTLLFLRQVGDAGLAAALVQRDVAPDERTLSSIWWLQLAISIGMVVIAFALAPYARWVWPTLPANATWLLRCLSLGVLLTMLRSVPFLLLERAVRFGPIGTLEFGGSVVYYGTAVALAARGAGAGALVAGALGQAAFVSIGANIVRPWRPAFVFDWQRVRTLLGFGLNFQGTSVLGFVNGAVTPVLVGVRLGREALGFVEFAQGTAFFPTQFVTIVRRVSFPFFSRLSHDPRAFAAEFERAILLCAVPVFFCLGLFTGSAPAIVALVYSDKWLPAVPALYVYSAAIAINFYSWIGGAALDALGASSTHFRLAVLMAVVNWPVAFLATSIQATPVAFALGFSVHMVLMTVLMHLALREKLPHARPLGRLWALVVAGLTTGVAGRLASRWIHGLPGLVAWVALAFLLYAGLALALDRQLRGALRQFASRRSAPTPRLEREKAVDLA